MCAWFDCLIVWEQMPLSGSRFAFLSLSCSIETNSNQQNPISPLNQFMQQELSPNPYHNRFQSKELGLSLAVTVCFFFSCLLFWCLSRLRVVGCALNDEKWSAPPARSAGQEIRELIRFLPPIQPMWLSFSVYDCGAGERFGTRSSGDHHISDELLTLWANG
jgi:hypothetical protein